MDKKNLQNYIEEEKQIITHRFFQVFTDRKNKPFIKDSVWLDIIDKHLGKSLHRIAKITAEEISNTISTGTSCDKIKVGSNGRLKCSGEKLVKLSDLQTKIKEFGI